MKTLLNFVKTILLSFVSLISLTTLADTITYVHSDHLGSVVAESNQNGYITERYQYKPFGDTRQTQQDDIGYTGHKHDPDIGLTYMQARYYDPVIGRFYSNDPIGFRGVHSFNRYAYANNNPYSYTDPTGMCSTDANAGANDKCQDVGDLDISTKGIQNIKDHENENYSQPNVHDDGAGNLTAGYGTKLPSDTTLKEGQPFPIGRANEELAWGIQEAEAAVEALMGDTQLSQNEMDAMVDLMYNVGPTALNKINSPGLNAAIKAGDYAKMAENLKYTKANGSQMGGLIDRSAVRKKIFTKGH